MESHIDFEKLVHLARLSLSPEEMIDFRRDLTQMTAFAATVVSELPSCKEEAEEGICPLREDVPHPCLSPSEVLDPGAKHRGGFVCVPSVMEESEHA